MRPRRPLRATSIALLAGVLLTACSNGDSPGRGAEPAPQQRSPLEAIELASSKTSEAKSAKLSFTVRTSGGAGQAETVTGEGVADFAANQLQMTMSAGAQRIDMVMKGTTMYMRMPGQSLVPGKSWLKMDLNAVAKSSGQQLGGLGKGAGASDPTQALALLKGASSDVQEVGREQIRGTDTTHYKANIDLRKAAEQQGPEAKKQLEQILKQAEVQSFPADVWIDDQGRLRQMRYKLQMRGVGAGQQGSATVDTTMQLFDFGTRVRVEAPPADQVADFSEMLQGLPGGSGG